MTTLCQYLAAQCLASGVRCAVAICVVLLVRLPSALTRLRGCCPRALLSPYVQPRLRCSITCPSRQGHRHWRAGRRPLPCQLRALQWVQGGGGRARDTAASGPKGFPNIRVSSQGLGFFRSQGLPLQSQDRGNFHLYLS